MGDFFDNMEVDLDKSPIQLYLSLVLCQQQKDIICIQEQYLFKDRACGLKEEDSRSARKD